MNQDQCEWLAEKILKEALENIERLGFVVMVREEYPEQADKKNIFLISKERHERGDYY